MAQFQLQQFQTRLQQLAPEQRSLIQHLYDQLLNQPQPLRLTLVGAFSVGKSSLLNSLLGERWLHTAQEEATALPTFIQYADTTTLQLGLKDGSYQTIDRSTFEHVTTHAPEDASHAILGLPQDWLSDVIVIDLPGLGSISEKNHAYTIAQIQQADVILYLIAPRGLSSSDVDAIKLIQSYGKHLLLLVNRWDEVLQAVERGEKQPDLEQWSGQLAEATGTRYPLTPTHFQGLNQQVIVDFVDQAKQQLENIRTRRFVAEVQPKLESLLGYNLEQQQACANLSEQQAQALHQQLLEKKHQLMDIKQGLYAQQEQEQQQLDQQLDSLLSTHRQQLEQQLNDISLHTEPWESYLAQGSQHVRLQVANSICEVQTLAGKFGEINLPTNTINELNLHLPKLEAVETNDFLQAAQLNQLKAQLLNKQNDYADRSQQLVRQDILDIELIELENAISSLKLNQQGVLNTPVPQIEEYVQDTSAADRGRAIGDTIENLLFFLPEVALSKLGKLGKVGKMVSQTGKAVNQIRQNVHQTVKQVPQSVESSHKNPLELLNLLSISTWAEKIGSLFDEPPQLVKRADPEIEAQVQVQAEQIQQNIRKLQDDLYRKQDMLSGQVLAGFALDQKKKEIEQLALKIAQLQQDNQQQQQQVIIEQQRQQQDSLKSYQVRAIRQWLDQYQQQVQGIRQYLRGYLKNYWSDIIDGQLQQRLQELDFMQQHIGSLPAAKVEQLAYLQQEQQQFEALLSTLK